MICEILSVGTELLMGQIANTDAQFLSMQLSELGITVYRHSVVGDNPARVKIALNEALNRSDIVITTGGLGPTEDDLTKEMVAEYFGLEMEQDAASVAALEKYMSGRILTDNNYKQTYFPIGSHILENRCGTAPGCVVEKDGKTVCVLPGPPRELKDMFINALRPYLEKKSGGKIYSRFLRIFGVGESNVETKLIDLFHLGDPTLALYCGAGEVQARISTFAAYEEDAMSRIDPVEREIKSILGDNVYGNKREDTLASWVIGMLNDKQLTVATAESLTGGMLSGTLVDVPGASAVFNEGYTTYSNEAKMRLLNVKPETINNFGAVSEQCAIEMAEGARKAANSDWALSTTGIAGPDGGTDEKPVGTVYIGIAGPETLFAKKYTFRGDRSWVRTLTVANALDTLRRQLL